MISPNDRPKFEKSPIKPIEPTSACVNMIYDASPITQAERMAAGKFIESVGGLERAKEVLRHMHQPVETEHPKEGPSSSFTAGPASPVAANQPTSRTTHAVINPALPDDDFAEAIRIAQAEYDQHHPNVVVGSSRGGAVGMNIDTQDTPLVLLCPAWKKWGTATKVKANATILHSQADDVVPFEDSEELVRNSGLPESALIEVGDDHRLADEEPLAKMLAACEGAVEHQDHDD